MQLASPTVARLAVRWRILVLNCDSMAILTHIGSWTARADVHTPLSLDMGSLSDISLAY
jgi:hypothetical protein